MLCRFHAAGRWKEQNPCWEYRGLESTSLSSSGNSYTLSSTADSALLIGASWEGGGGKCHLNDLRVVGGAQLVEPWVLSASSAAVIRHGGTLPVILDSRCRGLEVQPSQLL